MILIIVFVILVIGILGLAVYDNDWFKHEWSNTIALIIGTSSTVIAILGLLVSGIIFSVNYLGVNGYIEECNKQYESLVFQVENNIYEDSFTTNSIRDLVKEVQEWNCDLARKKVNQYDPWIGIFIPDIYDQFEFISLDRLAAPHWWEEDAE